MAIQPGTQEIAFAQMRMRLQDELSPYFMELAQSPDFELIEFEAALKTKDGGPPLGHTIKDQTMTTSAELRTADGNLHRLMLLIQHTEEWYAAITVQSDAGGPTQTIIVRRDVDEALPALKSLIDEAFGVIRRS
jgi:hypothetical protein